jgi:hypothetical protein
MQKLVVSWYSEFQDFVKYDLSDQIMNTFYKLEMKNNYEDNGDAYNQAINELKKQIKNLQSENDDESIKEVNELLKLVIDLESFQE